MSEVISFDDIDFEPLSDSNVPKNFDCGDADLNEFILKDALIHQEHHVAMTTLVHCEGEFVGFFSLAADCIALANKEKQSFNRHVRYREYPALKICRLAICNDAQGQGIGRIVFNTILGFAVEELQPYIGVRFVSVDAYEKSESFYEGLGFIRNVAEIQPEQDIISMRFDIEPTKPAKR